MTITLVSPSLFCVYSLILFSECVFSVGSLKRHGRFLLPNVQSSTLNNTLKSLPFEAHYACAFIGCSVVSPPQADPVDIFKSLCDIVALWKHWNLLGFISQPVSFAGSESVMLGWLLCLRGLVLGYFEKRIRSSWKFRWDACSHFWPLEELS